MQSQLLRVALFIIGIIIVIASSDNPPNGRTGAPFDGTCNDCHGGTTPGGYAGTVAISGLPDPVSPNTTYPVTLTVTVTGGNPVRSGFQLVAVQGNNTNAGDLTAVNGEAGTEMLGGREYIDHRNPKNFGGNPTVSWTFNWTSPASSSGGVVTFYFTANLANGSGSSGDLIIFGSQTFNHSGATPLSASITNVVNVSCFSGADGSATVAATGGTSPYSYSWPNGQTTATATNLPAGNHIVTVTDNAGATTTATAMINQPPQIAINLSTPNTITCAQPTSSVTATVGGGTPGYSYLWSNGATTQVLVTTTAGAYTLTVTDSRGCTRTAQVNILQNTNTPSAVAGTAQVISCQQPQVTLNGSGSTTGAGIQYNWTTSNGNIVSGANTLTPVVNQAGTYTLTVLNTANGCFATSNVSVTGNTTPPVAVAGTAAVLTCAQTQVTLSGAGSTTGTGIQYSWTTANGNIVSGANTLTPVVNAAGTYTLTVLNNNNLCSATAATTVSSNTTPPIVNATGGTLTCDTQQVTLGASVSSGGSPVTYLWSGPGGFSSTAQNPQVTVAGPYVLTVTATANSCSATDTATVSLNTAAPLINIATPGVLTCNVPAVQLNAQGSAQGPAFAYNWTTANGNIVSGATTLTPTVNAAGTYTLQIENTATGCTSADSVQVSQESPVTAAISSTTDVSCAGGSDGAATVTASGPGAFSYLWVNGATTPSVTGLMAGSYNVTVTDGNNCTAVATAVIGQPNALNLTATATHETANDANDGAATASVQGGTPAYAYLWSNGANTQTITGLAPGIYTVSVTDANGCTAVQTVTVNAFNCALSITISGEDITCFGASDGSASVSPAGAADPVSYLWSNGATTPDITGLTPGVYSVTIEDSAGCAAGASITINEPAELQANASATAETANGANDGTAAASPQGGVGPYTVLWSNGATTLSIQGLSPGTYIASVTDANGCEAVQSVNVNAFNCALSLEALVVDAACFGENSGAISVLASGGTAPYNYVWSNGAIGSSIQDLPAGTYTVTVFDGLACLTTATYEVLQPALLTLSPVSITNVDCSEDHDGQIIVAAAGGVTPYAYQWSHSGQGPVAFALVVGTYTVSVTDGNGCRVTWTGEITAQDSIPPLINCGPDISLCEGDILNFDLPAAGDNCSLPDGAVIQTGGLPSGSEFPLGVTVQSFMVTDQVGNTAECSHTVTVEPTPELSFDITGDVNNAGTGGIQTSVGSGNVIQYFWIGPGNFTAETPDIDGLVAGVYLLTAVDANGCSAEYAVQVPLVVGTNNIRNNNAVKIYPNPASDLIRIETTGFLPTAAQLFDARGQLIADWDVDLLKSPLNIAALPAGVYALQVVDEQQRVYLQRWIKIE